MQQARPISNIIIVGAGSTGLWSALYLAEHAQACTVNIRVIEASKAPFTAASSNCTGCIHYEFSEAHLKPLVPFGKYSFDLWKPKAEDPVFKLRTGYKAQSSFGVVEGSGNALELLPGWIHRESYWDVDDHVLGAESATVDPRGVGDWLKEQCVKRGVKLEIGLEATAVCLTEENEVEGLTCKREDLSIVEIDCDQLLLACGPWTPQVYKKLFPTSPISLEWTTDAGDWISFQSPCNEDKNAVAFVSFAEIAGEKMEFAGRKDGTIWACGKRNTTATLPPPCGANEPDAELVKKLREYASKWIEWKCNCSTPHETGLQFKGSGRAFRPATKSGLPILSEVASAHLTDNKKSCNGLASTGTIRGVFICWGHGSYGLTLGLGSGKLMSQLMLGQEPDIDLSPFKL